MFIPDITTITRHLYAQNFPSLTTMTSIVILMVLVFLPGGALVGLLGQEATGDVIVTVWLLGCFIGALMGGLSATYGIITAGYVPWGLTIFLAMALVVWLLKGGGN